MARKKGKVDSAAGVARVEAAGAANGGDADEGSCELFGAAYAEVQAKTQAIIARAAGVASCGSDAERQDHVRLCEELRQLILAKKSDLIGEQRHGGAALSEAEVRPESSARSARSGGTGRRRRG